MATALVPVAERAGLDRLALADAPDLPTAIAAGLAHGLTEPEALKSAFGKWMSEHAADVQRFGLANFYDGADSSRAMVNYSRLAQFLCVVVAEQQRQIAALTRQIRINAEKID
jgi:hypothetical protein